MREINFERTVWAERKLAKLCPNNDIKRIGELLTSDDFDQQMEAIENMVCIMSEAYERKRHFLDNSYQMNVVTREELECMTELELMELSNKALVCMSPEISIMQNSISESAIKMSRPSATA